MRDLIQRRDKTYSEIRMAAINDLDKIASILLAFCYSGHRSQESQKYIQFDCVAVCMVGDDLWVAANGIGIQHEDVDKLLAMMEEQKYPFEGYVYIVTRPGQEAMHAEMKLLSELHESGMKTLYIGVTKPCCVLCKQQLDNDNIMYAQWHNQPVTGWIPPYVDKPKFV